EDLSRLTVLAHKKGTRVHVALNSLVKPDESEKAGKLLSQLNTEVAPDALIIQDLCFVSLLRQVGFKGELHLSTLANLSFPSALAIVKKSFGVSQVVIPREFDIDEIRTMAAACPGGVGLEVFVHGALCYGISGRCYWSSYMGGKSGLRGRCVQPCRRVYNFKGQEKRF
ncbi:MAG: U32 family peptidase, partial [Desulfobacterales bacterium]|nr:U32 family peptidase [Desulfobacterales bacterium]